MPGQEIIDISSNNTHPIDWAAVKASGVSAVFIKATEGTTYVNPCWDGPDYHDRDDALAAGLDVVAYHYASFTDAAAEAAHFKAVAGDRARILDGETSTSAAWENAFLTALAEPDDEELTYGSASTIPASGITRGFTWPAAWGPNDPRVPKEVAWQDSDAGSIPGIQGRVDTTVWTGTDEAYQTFVGGTVPAPPPGPLPVPPTPTPPSEVNVQVPVLSQSNPGENVVDQRVKNLQVLLIAHGFLPPGSDDGRFGPHTAGAVVACEQHFGLGVDAGIAGEQVWTALCNR